ncbi:MAG: hypothetical protein IJL06_10390 [Kiritimatiellae bacterium]|nr:hypothetical protein [Kiritimatiellia bacterium]
MKPLVPLFLLLALLAAVPLSLKPLLRVRFERAEADAFAAYPPPADTNGPAFPEIPAYDDLPLLRHSPTVQPLPPDYLEAVRAWCASNPAAIAAFDRVTDPEHPFRPSRSFDVLGGMGRTLAYAVLGKALLLEAVERGDAARVEDLDRRLRSFARMLGAPLVPKLLARAVGRIRHSILPRALPLLPDAYLDECDADARERIRTAAADAAFAFGADLPFVLVFMEDQRGGNGSKNPFLRYASDCDYFLSAANSCRIYANVPAALARCEALFDEPREAFPDGLEEAAAILVDGCCEQWPRAFAVIKDRWTGLDTFFLVGTGFPIVPCYADVRNDAELERLVIALERHRRRTGSYPARLADLVGGDEDALPRMFPTGDPPDYEAGDLPVRVQRLAVRLNQDDEEPEDDEPTSAVFRGYRLRVRPSPRLKWSTHGPDCEFSPDCVYHLDAGTLCAPAAEPDPHAEPAE